MARRTVVEVGCSRCSRTEFIEGTVHANEDRPPALHIAFGDLKVTFEDLCGPCKGAVQKHIEAIGKKIEGLSPERKGKDEEEVPDETPKKKREAKKKGSDDVPNPSSPTPPTAPPSRLQQQMPGDG